MSTIKTSNLQNGSSSSVNIALNTDGSATFAQMPVGPSYFAMRNKIINGAMEIDQRNAGASVTIGAGTTYTLDRWWGEESTDGTMTAQRSSDAPTGFINSATLTTGTADSSLAASQYVIFSQTIEGFNIADFAWGSANAKTITLSFWVKSSLTGTFGGVIRNSGNTRSYIFTYSINVAGAWEKKTIVITGDTTGTWLTNNATGLGVSFSLGAGSTFVGTAGTWSAGNLLTASGCVSVIGTAGATWQITGVQIEEGSVATPFERRNYQTEFDMCLRYYELSASIIYQTAGSPYTQGYWSVQKRTNPTLTVLAYDSGSGGTFTNSSMEPTKSFFQNGNHSATVAQARLAGSAEL